MLAGRNPRGGDCHMNRVCRRQILLREEVLTAKDTEDTKEKVFWF
jgi:hypothetical protein